LVTLEIQMYVVEIAVENKYSIDGPNLPPL
jgi:hypothetical protein